jgi:hypothetical protein
VGLHFVRNRWYDPEGGRFVNEDPAGFAGGMNLYAYAGDDPVNGHDPMGLTQQMAGCAIINISGRIFFDSCGGGGSLGSDPGGGDGGVAGASDEAAHHIGGGGVPGGPGRNGAPRVKVDVGDAAEAMCAFRVLTTLGTGILDTFGAGELLRSGRAFASALYNVVRASDPSFHFLGSMVTEGTKLGFGAAETASDNGLWALLIGGVTGESPSWWEFMPVPYASMRSSYNATKQACLAPGAH